MTIPVFGAAGTVNSGSSSAGCAPAFPAGISANMSLLYFAFADDNAAGTVQWNTVPTGFTLIGKGQDNTRRSSALFWKNAVGSESGSLTLAPTVTNGTGTAIGQIVRWTGTKTTTAFEGFAAANGSSTSAPPGSVTTANANDAVIAAIAYENAGTCGTISGSSPGSWVTDSGPNAATYSIDWQSIFLGTPGTVSGGSATLGTTGIWHVLACGLIPLATTFLSAKPKGILQAVNRAGTY